MKIGPVIATVAALSACAVPTIAQAVNPREDALMYLTERAKNGAVSVLRGNPNYSPVNACKLATMNDYQFGVNLLEQIYQNTSTNNRFYSDNDIQRVVSGCVKKVTDLKGLKQGALNSTSLTKLANEAKFIARA